MGKFLSTKSPEQPLLPYEAFQFASENFSFNKKGIRVTPYTIVTDGENILTYENEFGEIELGFFCSIPKKHLLYKRKTTKNFRKFVEKGVRTELTNRYEYISCKRHEEYRKLNKDEIYFSVSYNGYFSPNNVFVPVCFINLPAEEELRLKPKEDTPEATSVNLATLSTAGNEILDKPFSLAGKAVLIMLISGEITIPPKRRIIRKLVG